MKKLTPRSTFPNGCDGGGGGGGGWTLTGPDIRRSIIIKPSVNFSLIVVWLIIACGSNERQPLYHRWISW